MVETIEALRLNGLNAASTLEEMTGVLQRMAVLQAVPARAAPRDATIPTRPRSQRLAGLCRPTKPSCSTACACMAAAELGLAPDEYAALTMVLLRLLAFKPAGASGGRRKKKL